MSTHEEPDIESLEFFLNRASLAELKFAIITQRNEIDDLRMALRAESDRVANLRTALETIARHYVAAAHEFRPG